MLACTADSCRLNFKHLKSAMLHYRHHLHTKRGQSTPSAQMVNIYILKYVFIINLTGRVIQIDTPHVVHIDLYLPAIARH